MLNKIFNRTKKTLLLSTVAIFTLFAVSNIYASPSSETAYMLQGASKTTMTDLVEQVGGKVIHDFSVINAISVSLTEEQADELNKMNPLVRLSSKSNTIETAGFVWPIRTKKAGAEVANTEIAGFVWPIRTKKAGAEVANAEIAGFVWPIRTKKAGAEVANTEIAGFVWPIRTKKAGAEVANTEIAGFVWPIRTKKAGAEVASFV